MSSINKEKFLKTNGLIWTNLVQRLMNDESSKLSKHLIIWLKCFWTSKSLDLLRPMLNEHSLFCDEKVSPIAVQFWVRWVKGHFLHGIREVHTFYHSKFQFKPEFWIQTGQSIYHSRSFGDQIKRKRRGKNR